MFYRNQLESFGNIPSMGINCFDITPFYVAEIQKWIANLEDITTKKLLVVIKIGPGYIGLGKETVLPILKYTQSADVDICL